ncbi:MAG TPA: PKD domain-containing protein [Caldilineaceae bacterium]|nr:PKD domain-containing protein [Caldilineaceae bacterium]
MLRINSVFTLWTGMVVGAVLLLAGLVAATSVAAGTLIGPLFPPPGGADVSASGVIGGSGGMDVVYTNFDFSQFDRLYWGPMDESGVEMALDGVVDAPQETLSFDTAQSDLSNGVARWSGQADLTHFVGGSSTTVAVNTRLTIRPSGLGGPLAMELASSLGITGSGAVLPVTDDYQVNLLAEIFWTGAWRPANVVFDSLDTLPGHRVVVNLYDSFFYTDQEIAGLVAMNDGPTVWGNSTALSATVSAGTHISYTWDFGDSQSGSGITTTHTYTAPGVYTATVTTTNTASTVTATTMIHVDEPISGLAADNSGPTILGASTMLTATVAAGSNVTFTWDCGDGYMDHGAAMSHLYAETGTYTATVTANNSVSSATATTTVVVEEPVHAIYLPLIKRDAQ